MGSRFNYVCDGTASGTVAISPGVSLQESFVIPPEITEEAMLFETGSSPIEIITNLPRCSSSLPCLDGGRCIGDICAQVYSDLVCKGDPPRLGAVCSLGQWFLQGGWFIQANQTVSITLEQETVVVGDLRFGTNSSQPSTIEITLTSSNNNITIQGCADFSSATLSVTELLASEIPVGGGTKMIDLVTFQGFCNGKNVRHHYI